jgi:hypothetical protein
MISVGNDISTPTMSLRPRRRAVLGRRPSAVGTRRLRRRPKSCVPAVAPTGEYEFWHARLLREWEARGALALVEIEESGELTTVGAMAMRDVRCSVERN